MRCHNVSFMSQSCLHFLFIQSLYSFFNLQKFFFYYIIIIHPLTFAQSLFLDSGMQCPVMADSDPSSSSINDTVTVNVGTMSNAIAAAIQQS